jgi:hypothetical protein
MELDPAYNQGDNVTIPYYYEFLTPTDELEHHMLYFCVLIKDHQSIFEFISKGVSPFRPSINEQYSSGTSGS